MRSRTDGKVTTTTPPADLELLVAGTRVFFRPGPAPPGFSQDVDVTAAVQAAVDAGGTVGADGNLTVALTLQARVPGTLGLAFADTVRFLRTFTVDFPGPTTSARFAEEGDQVVPLPLPADASAWTIHRLVASLAADDPGPLRVQPPVGPAPSTNAELLLSTDSRLVVKLPSGPLGRFQTVSGVRVLLTAGTSGIEIGGALLGGTETTPGDPLPKATMAPVSLPASSSPAWATLSLARPFTPPPGVTLWLSLAVNRGSAVMALTDLATTAAGDVSAVRRIAPNGISHPLSAPALPRANPGSAPVLVDTAALALRVVGTPPDKAPIDVAVVDLDGGGATASSTTGSVALSLTAPGPRTPLALRASATAATTVTIGPVVVAYTEGAAP